MTAEVGPVHSVAYSGAIDNSPGENIGVQTVPEPSVVSLVVLGAGAVGARLFRKRVVKAI